MYTRGLRPFQSVVYVTDNIKEHLEWNGLELVDLFYFSKVNKVISDKELLTIMTLNTENNKTTLFNPLPLGIETLLRNWYQSADEDCKERLDRLSTEFKIRNTSALENTLKSDISLQEENRKGYEIVSDQNQIYVVLKKNERNLLDQKTANQLLAAIARDVVKVLTTYHGYKEVPNNPWFIKYIEHL